MDHDYFRWLFKAIVHPYLDPHAKGHQHDRKCAAKSDEDGPRTERFKLSIAVESTEATNYSDNSVCLIAGYHYRRLIGDMIEIYKVIRKVFDTEAAPIMPMTGPDRSTITRGNPYKMYKRRVKTQL